MAWPSVYTYNFCPNPSFERDLTGVNALNGASLVIDMGTGLYGTQSLVVSTPGQQTAEGVICAPGTVLGTATGCVSFWVQGNDVTSSGSLTALVIDQTSSTTLGTTNFTFDPTTGWTQVVLNGLALVNAHVIALYIETNGTQQTAFNIDGIQYEPTTSVNGGTLPTPYCDGDQLFCTWISTAGLSASQKFYQFMMGASGDIIT